MNDRLLERELPQEAAVRLTYQVPDMHGPPSLELWDLWDLAGVDLGLEDAGLRRG